MAPITDTGNQNILTMTVKQIEAAKRSLPGFWEPKTTKQRRLQEELSCRSLINSSLIYGTARYDFYDPATGEFGCNAKDYVKSLKEETVIRLYNEQAGDFSKAIVKHDVHTDNEGVTYNACIWEDEQ